VTGLSFSLVELIDNQSQGTSIKISACVAALKFLGTKNPIADYMPCDDNAGQTLARSKPERLFAVPIGRYFFFVGSLLLALLFFGSRYLPDYTSQNFQREADDVDRSIIRINSAHKWPERIVFDTSLPTIVPPPQQQVANVPDVRSPTEAFAQVTSPVPKSTEPVRPRTKRKVAARRVSVARTAAFWPASGPMGW
jgi:hypothetical protein